MEYKIEKGIELIPKRKSGCKYPFGDMNVGDSFIYDEYSRKNQCLISNAARNWVKKAQNNWIFAVRKTEDNKIRIWRIK